MTDPRTEKRANTRVVFDLPVEVHQGGSVWHQRLIDLSLSGVATDQPDLWDAQYNEPFTLIVHTGDEQTLEMHAYLQHVESGRLGFSVGHVDDANLGLLRDLLASRLPDPAILDAEVAQRH